MLAQYFGLGALALGMANAWTFPDCEPDNCYRALIDARFTAEVGPFCKGYLDGSIKTVATDFSNCDAQAASSACSCVYYTMTHTSEASTTSTTYPATTTPSSSTYATTTPSSSVYPTTTPSTSTPYPTYTTKATSTMYTTSTYTITSCAASVTDCPVGKVTTTVCPVSTPTVYPTTIVPVTTYPATSVGTVTVPTKTSSTSLALQVTAAAGRVERGIELAVAAGALALAVL